MSTKLADLAYRYLAQTARETNDELGLEALQALLTKFEDSLSGLDAQPAVRTETSEVIEQKLKELRERKKA